MRPHHETDVSRADYFAAICAALWAERDVLQDLVGSIVTERVITDPSGTGSAPLGADTALRRLAMQDVLRAAMVESLASTAQLPSSATLPHLVRIAPEPWRTMLQDHGSALRSLLADVTDLGDVQQLSLAEFLGA